MLQVTAQVTLPVTDLARRLEVQVDSREKRWDLMLGTVNKPSTLLALSLREASDSPAKGSKMLATTCFSSIQFCLKQLKEIRPFLTFQQLHVKRVHVCEAGGEKCVY